MGDTLRVGIIGCGALGRVHAERFRKMAGVDVVAVSDPDEAGMARAASQAGSTVEILSVDYREILGCRLDIVCIASPDSFHVEQVLDSLAAGAHVLCEKPLTPRLDEMRRVVEARDANGRHVALTYFRRYTAQARTVRREILSGRWGRVLAASIYNAEDWMTGNRGTWRHDPAICPGGFLYDANGHQIDTFFWMTGCRPGVVRARQETCGTPVPIHVWGNGATDEGAPITFHFAGMARAWREQINIHCEGAEFVIENMQPRCTSTGKTEPIEPLEPGETSNSAFVRLIRGEGPNWSPPESAEAVIRFTSAALRSASSGGVEVDSQT